MLFTEYKIFLIVTMTFIVAVQFSCVKESSHANKNSMKDSLYENYIEIPYSQWTSYDYKSIGFNYSPWQAYFNAHKAGVIAIKQAHDCYHDENYYYFYNVFNHSFFSKKKKYIPKWKAIEHGVKVNGITGEVIPNVK